MQYRRLGRSGLEVSPLCVGCMSFGKHPLGEGHAGWTLDEEASRPLLRRAIELGINFFDTSNSYSLGQSEEIVGRAIRDFGRRDEVVIATKVFAPMKQAPNSGGLGRKHVIASCEASLKRLGTDFIDLFQIHRWDMISPIEETLEALDDLVRAGKILYAGSSSMYAWQFAHALAIQEREGWARFVSMQPQYNLIYREEEREMLPLCRYKGIGVIPWSPLARGFLAGNRSGPGEGQTARARSDAFADRMYFQQDDFTVLERVTQVACARGVSNTQIALAWVASRPEITAPVVGATKLHHLEEAVAALKIVLSDEEITRLEEVYRPHAVLGHGYEGPMGAPVGSAQRSVR